MTYSPVARPRGLGLPDRVTWLPPLIHSGQPVARYYPPSSTFSSQAVIFWSPDLWLSTNCLVKMLR